MLIRIGWLIGLLLLNAFFVAAEFALVRSRKTRLETLARSGDLLARVALSAIDDLPRMLSVTQVAITLCGLGMGWVAEDALVGAMGAWVSSLPVIGELAFRATIATVIALTVVTFFTVVFGELTPKTAALNHPETLARFVSPVIVMLEVVVRPFTWLLNRTANFAVRALGQTPMEGEDAVHSPEEIRMLVEQSQESGAIQQQDAELIDAVFEFSEKNAREVMTPRTDIIAIDVNATLDEVMQTIHENRKSRYPIYEETVDDIIGVLLVKDLIRVFSDSPRREHFSVRPLMRPPHFVPGSREVEDVLADFKRHKQHMAIVLDEYGGTAGVVTMEDLLEEIVGEILDEYDTDEITELDGQSGVLRIQGSMNISEFNEEFGFEISDEYATTIGGFVFGTLGRLPVIGDRITINSATFTVVEMEGRRVATLQVEMPTAQTNAPPDALPE